MPTYEYKCRACDHAFEEFQKMSAAAIETCPSCGEDAVQRLISSGGGLVFKGSGFYATDYRKDGPSDSGSSSESGDSGSGSGDSGSGSGDSGSGSGDSGSASGDSGSASGDSGSASGDSGKSSSSKDGDS